ncbi:MAG: N-glycosylase/DNA lyase [bacterium]
MIDEVKGMYLPLQRRILLRIEEFEIVGKTGSEDDIFTEFIFCMLTPQCRARRCWSAVQRLKSKKLLLHGSTTQIADELYDVRFKNNKAKYIIEARNFFTIQGEIIIKSKITAFNDAGDARQWLVQHIKGMGYKEASHFLRNIGRGLDLAILDRHIVKNLYLLKVIEKLPTALPMKLYLDIERKMKEFAQGVGIPMPHLDLLLWYKETGEIFK